MKNLFIAALVTFAAGSAFAVGDAGCGLGSMIIKDNTKVMQILAATTNGTFGSQTFGISTGTSNCTSDKVVLQEKEQQYFVEANYDMLTTEMAQGSGEYVDAFAHLLGCDSNEFGALVKKNYSEIVKPNGSATEVLSNVRQHAKVISCAKLG